MRTLTLGLLAVCMFVALGAHAAQGSPADTDKAGRAGPGTAAGQQGASDPSKTAGSSTGSGSAAQSGSNSGGTSASTGAGSTGGASTAGASSGSTGASATTGASTDDTKGRRSRRAARASKG